MKTEGQVIYDNLKSVRRLLNMPFEKSQNKYNELKNVIVSYVEVERIDDALELLKEQQGTGCWEWIVEDKYRCSECHNTTYVDECMEEPQYLFCPYCGHKMTFAGRN